MRYPDLLRPNLYQKIMTIKISAKYVKKTVTRCRAAEDVAGDDLSHDLDLDLDGVAAGGSQWS
jgi:hypothetical protein